MSNESRENHSHKTAYINLGIFCPEKKMFSFLDSNMGYFCFQIKSTTYDSQNGENDNKLWEPAEALNIT